MHFKHIITKIENPEYYRDLYVNTSKFQGLFTKKCKTHKLSTLLHKIRGGSLQNNPFFYLCTGACFKGECRRLLLGEGVAGLGKQGRSCWRRCRRGLPRPGRERRAVEGPRNGAGLAVQGASWLSSNGGFVEGSRE